MDRNYLKGSQGDAINVILAAAGYNLTPAGLAEKFFARMDEDDDAEQ